MKKILIAEDDEFLADSYQAKITSEGVKVLIARDGEEALSQIRSFMPDLVILDLVMPKKNGIDVLRELNSDEKIKNIPVVVASNIDQKKTIDEALKLGAKEYFIKSDISISELSKICQKYIKE